MLVSELIKELNELLEKEGDLEVLREYDGMLFQTYTGDVDVRKTSPTEGNFGDYWYEDEDGEKKLII